MRSDLLRRLVSAGYDNHRNTPRWDRGADRRPLALKDVQVFRHRVKAFWLAPEFLEDWVRVGRKLSHFADQALECACWPGAKYPDESPWRTWRTAAQQGQARADDTSVREHRAYTR